MSFGLYLPGMISSGNGNIDIYYLEVMQNISDALWKEADISITSTTPNELNTVINSADPDSIIEVKTDATYSQVIVPADKKITVRSAIGYSPIISDAGALVLSDGTKDFTMSGFRFENCTPFGNSNNTGEAITMGADKTKYENIIFNNCYFGPADTGSMVMLAYHWNQYYVDHSINDLSTKAAFISCFFYEACKNNTEGAGLHIRAVDTALVDNCKLNGNDLGRCIQFQCSQNIRVTNNKVYHSGTRECIKLDLIGTAGSFISTGIVANNEVWSGSEGIDLDDSTETIVMNNEVYDCTDGIIIDDSSRSKVEGNYCYNNSNIGFSCEEGSIVDLQFNIAESNITNYSLPSGYTLPVSNANL